jgi:hypothetical protein
MQSVIIRGDMIMAKKIMPKRESNAAVIYCAISVLLIIAFSVLGVSAFTQASVIEVEGAIHYTSMEIIDASGFSFGDNLMFLDVETAEVRIQTLLPHISYVSIRTVFPDTINISVVESSPIATVRYRNGILVIDSGARVVEILSHENQVSEGLIEIRGFTPLGADLGSILRVEAIAESQLQFLVDMLQSIEEEGFRGYVTFIDISNIANITFDYTDRYRVILDSPSSISQNMRILRSNIEVWERDGSIEPGVGGTITRSDSRGTFSFTPDR